jgi:protein CpxP
MSTEETSNTMKHSVLQIAGVAALAAGMAFGQSAPTQPNQQNQPKNHMRRGAGGPGAMFERFGADLNLTDAQKEQAKQIFADARKSSESVHSQLSQNKQALSAAVKSGASEAQIDKLSNDMAPLLAQTTAIHTKAFAKFYALLTPEQKDKVNARMDRMMNFGDRAAAHQHQKKTAQQ